MSPVRIQRKRTKGWRMPEGAVYVGRPGKWGNPFAVHNGDYAYAVQMFRENFHRIKWADDVGELAGKNLACWCKLTDPCHADVLLEIANQP